jgi:hypothetical protein
MNYPTRRPEAVTIWASSHISPAFCNAGSNTAHAQAQIRGESPLAPVAVPEWVADTKRYLAGDARAGTYAARAISRWRRRNFPTWRATL